VTASEPEEVCARELARIYLIEPTIAHLVWLVPSGKDDVTGLQIVELH
jgi:hypothetical protein